MKVLFDDEYHMVIFLFRDCVSNIDFTSKEDLEGYFKKLFPKLNEYYDVQLDGFLDITIYMDSYYGAIIEIEKDSLDYPYATLNEVEMSIHIVKNSFVLYEIDDPFLFLIDFLKKQKLYCYRNHYYLYLQDEVDDQSFYSLLEQCHIIYGNITNNIVHYGQLLKL